jgi:hypothetical protein
LLVLFDRCRRCLSKLTLQLLDPLGPILHLGYDRCRFIIPLLQLPSKLTFSDPGVGHFLPQPLQVPLKFVSI